MKYDDEIDWHKQWEAHAHGFQDGLSHINFEELGLSQQGSIILAPGPGFGDLSHPTTRLVLCMMAPHIENKSVLDVGCGSGILSLAAARLGAKSVFGLDIDDNAVAHAKHNAALNNLSSICKFGKSANKPSQILLMNMIRSEQKVAYSSLKPACRSFELAFTSGILKEERDLYLTQTTSWGWKCRSEHTLHGWLSFCFTQSS